MTKRLFFIVKNDDGSVLLSGLLILAILTLIGISAINNTNTEMQIADNDKKYKKAFYAADGGTEIGRELVEQNIACPDGFTTMKFGALEVEYSKFALDDYNPGIEDVNKNGSLDEGEDLNDNGILDKIPQDDQRDIHYLSDPKLDADDEPYEDPLIDGDSVPHTNIVAAEKTVQLIAGNSMLMAEGYSGLGKGSGSGGAEKLYDIYSKFEHRSQNSCALVIVEYRHIIGTEGDCEN